VTHLPSLCPAFCANPDQNRIGVASGLGMLFIVQASCLAGPEHQARGAMKGALLSALHPVSQKQSTANFPPISRRESFRPCRDGEAAGQPTRFSAGVDHSGPAVESRPRQELPRKSLARRQDQREINWGARTCGSRLSDKTIGLAFASQSPPLFTGFFRRDSPEQSIQTERVRSSLASSIFVSGVHISR
jgi:hypothetical protein